MAILNVSDADVMTILEENPNVAIKFYAGWCGSCRLISPKYKSLADNAKYEDVVFLDIDAENNPEIRKLAGVNNLPFFATFKNGALKQTTFTAKIEKVDALVEELIG